MEGIRQLAHDFIKAAGVTRLQLNMDDLFTVCKRLDYHPLTYSESAQLITRYKLRPYTRQKAFAYVCDEFKIIFYNESMSYADKLFSLAHEIGHIYLGHCHDGNTYRSPNYTSVQEIEANTFAYELLAPLCILSRCHVHTLAQIKSVTLLNEGYAEHILAELTHYSPSREDQALEDRYNVFIAQHIQNRKSKRTCAVISGAFMTLGFGFGVAFGISIRSH